jgi:hypothetical protein
MSLEKAVQENTEAINRLIATIEAARTTGSVGSDKVKVEHPVAQDVKKEEAAQPTYDDVRKAFKALLLADRPAAVKLLADLGVANLGEVEKKPETFAEVLAAIKGVAQG